MAGFVEGKLSQDEERFVWEHIDRCPKCMADFQQSLFLAHLLQENLPPVEPPADLLPSIVKNLPH
jgi:anti-sigma factor RsiW